MKRVLMALVVMGLIAVLVKELPAMRREAKILRM